MIFPELAGRIKGWISEHNDGPTTLGLKDAGYGYGQLSSPAEWYQRNGWYGIAAGLSAGAPTWAGERVTLASALNHSVVWACNRAISEPVGFLPLNLMRRTDRGKEFATSHPMYSALHDSPNDEMSAQSFRETLTSHALLQGNGYAQILRRSGTGVAIELRALNPQQVNVDRDGQGRLVYVISDLGNSDVSYTVQRGKPQDILHLKGIGNNGIIGYSVLQMARESIGTGLAAEKTVARFFAAGGRVPYILDLEHKFATDQDRDKFRADWETIYSQPHRAPILPPGIKYQQIGLNHADAQMLEQRQFTIPEICRWFNVSPHLAGDLSRATFCMTGETEVYTEEGPQRIDEVCDGDRVWSRSAAGAWVLSTVLRSACTGHDQILTIKTTNRTIRLNAKHRVLARVKTLVCAVAVRGKPVAPGQHPVKWENAWVPAGELKAGDTIVNLQSLPDVPACSNVIPSGREATVEFMEFCGLLAGDGNITIVNGEPVGVQIARAASAPYMDHYREVMRSLTLTRTEPDRSGENHPGAKLSAADVEKIRIRLQTESAASIARDLGLHRSTIQKLASGKLWGKSNGGRVKDQPSTISEQPAQTRFKNATLARELHLLGLGGTARTKRVPGWVFTLPGELRAGYVRGFLDADGSVDKQGRASFSSCNPRLLSQLRHLCMGLGVPVTNQRLQTGQTKLPNGRIIEYRQYIFTCSDPQGNLKIGSHTPEYVRRMKAGKPFCSKERGYPRYGGAGFAESGCELARIKSIELSQVHEPVYDLEVEDTHSFIADGVVVHNSNVEQLALDHIKFCLSAWFSRWESELFRCVLTPQEKASGYYFKHNVNALLRGDFASRMAGYATSLQNGYKNIDEVRDLEDDNPLPDGAGESYHIQMNMATVPGTGDPMIAEQAQLLKITGEPTPGKQDPAADSTPAQLSAAKKEIESLSAELKKQQALASQPVTKVVHRDRQGLIVKIEEVRKD